MEQLATQSPQLSNSARYRRARQWVKASCETVVRGFARGQGAFQEAALASLNRGSDDEVEPQQARIPSP
eukprot:2056620-Prorocentrum_lima.AAC.1